MYYFEVSFIASFLVFCISLYLTRGISLFSSDTDNEKQSMCASDIKLLDWPAKMHDFPYTDGRSAMKIFFVYSLSVIIKLFRIKGSERPLTILCLVANFISALLIYLILEFYFSSQVAFWSSLLFSFSIWPSQLALHGGPICVSQTCFLLSIYILTLSNIVSAEYIYYCYFFAGISAGLCQFSSGSARKYIPLTVICYFYSLYQIDYLEFIGVSKDAQYYVPRNGLICIFIISIVFLLLNFNLKKIYISLKKEMFSDISQSEKKIKDRIFKLKNHLLRMYLLLVVFSLLGGLLVNPYSFYFITSLFFLGVIMVVVWATYPKVLRNLLRYAQFYNADKWAPRFPMYDDYFISIGRPIPNGMRGAGIKWVSKFLKVIMPFELILIVLMLLVYSCLVSFEHEKIDINFIAILIVSLTPILVAEFTKAPQMGRSYFPAINGTLMLFAFLFFIVLENYNFLNNYILFCVYGLIFISIIRNIHVYITDILPSRMCVTYIIKYLDENNIVEFSTYQTEFNDAFVSVIEKEFPNKYKINYITSLAEVNNAVVIIPSVTSKSFNMESQQIAINNGDFNNDPVLCELINTKKIDKLNVVKLKAFGTSKIWGHESEVLSYRSLILNEIKSEDYYKGFVWIINKFKHEYIKTV